jgi:hypothetical protein
MRLGARPYRCEYCRINFVSFRRRLEKFSFRRWKTRNRHREAAETTSVAAGEDPTAKAGEG